MGVCTCVSGPCVRVCVCQQHVAPDKRTFFSLSVPSFPAGTDYSII